MGSSSATALERRARGRNPITNCHLQLDPDFADALTVAPAARGQEGGRVSAVSSAAGSSRQNSPATCARRVPQNALRSLAPSRLLACVATISVAVNFGFVSTASRSRVQPLRAFLAERSPLRRLRASRSRWRPIRTPPRRSSLRRRWSRLSPPPSRARDRGHRSRRATHLRVRWPARVSPGRRCR